MTMITLDVQDAVKKLGKFNKLPKVIINGVVRGINEQTTELHRYIVKRHLSGASRTDPVGNFQKQKLRRRTGEFARKTLRNFANRRQQANGIVGGITFEAKYAPVHVGEKGKVTTITPVNKQWLTIPLPPALTRAGVLRKPARDYNDLFFLPRAGKNPLLVKSTGRGKVKPYFVLTKQVKIRARIHPKEILKARRNVITAGIRKAILTEVRKQVTS